MRSLIIAVAFATGFATLASPSAEAAPRVVADESLVEAVRRGCMPLVTGEMAFTAAMLSFSAQKA